MRRAWPAVAAAAAVLFAGCSGAAPSSPAPAAEPGAAARALIAPMRGHVELSQGSEALFRDLTRYPVKDRFLFAAVTCAEEVRAGGLQRFFAEPAGTLAPEAIAAFKVMGMAETAAQLQRAADRLGTPFPRDLAARRTAAQREADALAAMDAAFVHLLSTEAGGLDAAADRLARAS